MCDRQNTIVCSFDMRSPKISARNIHDWLHEKMQLPTDKVSMIQFDITKRKVYIKLVDEETIRDTLQKTNGQLDYKHDNGEISMVQIERAGLGVKRVRVANLQPEVPVRLLREAMSPYGEVRSVTEETWSKAYRYPVSNGIRVVEIELKKHIPSHMMLVGNRMLLSYEGQPLTCYGCNQPGHQYNICPNRRQANTSGHPVSTQSWANIVTGSNIHGRLAPHPPSQDRLKDMEDVHSESKATAPVEVGKTLDRGEGGTESSLWSSMLDESEQNKVGTLSDAVRKPCGRDSTSSTGETHGDDNRGQGESLIAPSEAEHIDGREDMDYTLEPDARENVIAQEPTEGDRMMANDEHAEQMQQNPKRSKKLKTDGGVSMQRDRSRSKSRIKPANKL
jgi:hypothetical protein